MTTEMTETAEVAITATLTATEIARHLGAEPKALRSFLRRNADDLALDHAHRASWVFSLDEARAVIAAFAARKATPTADRSDAEIAALLAPEADDDDDAEGELDAD